MCAGVSQFSLCSAKASERRETCTPNSVSTSPKAEPGMRDVSPRPGKAPRRAAKSPGLTQARGRSGDTSPMATRLTSNQFVGRTAELEELDRALRGAAEGRPGLVLLGGDSGVGKTRLITELERRLTTEGVTVLRGEAVEQQDGELPFAPLTSAFRPLVRARHPAFDALGRGSRAELAALLPGLEDRGDRHSERHDATAQLRLFEALLELLDVISEEQPLLLILEDIHWSDRSTRTFAAFLARSLRLERVAVVLTYRTDELHRRHPLRPLLSELERLDNVRRVELAPFVRDELAQVLAHLLGPAPDGDEQEAELAAAIAGHYAAAGDQPSALRATVRAALAARDVHAYGEAADLAERALELWPRVPDAEETIPLSRVDMLELAASAHSIAGDRLRAQTLLESALAEVDPDSNRHRYARLLARQARVQWSPNAGLQGGDTAQRALSMLPADEVSVERVSLMAWLARTRFLRGRYREAIVEGEAALEVAKVVGDAHTEGEIL